MHNNQTNTSIAAASTINVGHVVGSNRKLPEDVGGGTYQTCAPSNKIYDLYLNIK